MRLDQNKFFFYLAKFFGLFIRPIPMGTALAFGRAIGILGYYLNAKHKTIAYSNIKIAFAKTKKPSEIKRIVRRVFENYGQNLIELFRLPLIFKEGCEKYVRVEGREYVYEELKKKKGVILLAMHFGSWELSSLMSTFLNHPYRVVAKPQEKFSKLDELLNSYRQCGGTNVISRGRGTREILESLKNNEVIGMVVDQGGKEGELVKFFGRLASMSVGAIRIGLKFGTPICFSVIRREKGAKHRLTIHPPLKFINTGDVEKDVVANLEQVVKLMEQNIEASPSEYMWFYKIWKYSKESTTVILSDGKMGHLRQSQAVAHLIDKALSERHVVSATEMIEVKYKNRLAQIMFNIVSVFSYPLFGQGRLRYLKWFLMRKSFLDLAHVKADFVISCGFSLAGVNILLAKDYRAKSVCIQKPGIMDYRKFDLVILPHHDFSNHFKQKEKIAVTEGAPTIIQSDYLKEQAHLLLKRFSHIKGNNRLKIGVLLGGNSKRRILSESMARVLIGQLKETCAKIDAEIFLTTSRRTPLFVEQLLQRELKNYPNCQLLILANRSNIPEAVGGMLGICELIVVSDDSITMISEAVASEKDTIVIPLQKRQRLFELKDKYETFRENLLSRGHIYVATHNDLSQAICSVARNKIRTVPLNDNHVIFEAVKKII